jgi:hypothetical protein
MGSFRRELMAVWGAIFMRGAADSIRCHAKCNRVFRRLDIAQESRHASFTGKTLLPAPDYALAEVFADDEPEPVCRPQIGFSS